MATITPPATAPDSFPLTGLRATKRTVTFSNSYTTGGEAVTAAQAGQRGIYLAIAAVTSASAGGVVNVFYNPATGNLQAFSATGEIAAATNLSGVSVDVVFIGPT